MKVILGLLGVLMLTLPSPSEAKPVYTALVSADVTAGVNTWDNLDAIIKSHDNDMDYYFKDEQNRAKNLTLQPDQELIIRGGRGSIKQELANYKTRSVILNNARNWETISAYGCYVKRGLRRENTTYIMLRTDHNWQGEKNCTTLLVGATGHVISVNDLHAAIRPPNEN
jgi:hypothetical protein